MHPGTDRAMRNYFIHNHIKQAKMNLLKKSTMVILAGAILAGGATSCSSWTNTGKGAAIGGGGGAALGAGIGALIGGGKGAGIGSAIGAVVGTGAGVLIGQRMDKQQKELSSSSPTRPKSRRPRTKTVCKLSRLLSMVVSCSPPTVRH